MFLANGAVTRREEQRGKPHPFEERNLLLRNAGPKFEDASAAAGPALAQLGVSRGAAFGDIDNDGDTDILVTVNNGPVRLLRNDHPARNWVRVDAPTGSRVVVKPAGQPQQTRSARTDSSYLTASDPRLIFGIGTAEAIEWVDITSPNGSTRRIPAPKLNQAVK